MIFQLVLIYFPALVFGFLFAKNYRKEPRQFRNALYFLLLCLFALYGLSIQFDLPWLVLIGLAAIPFGTVALVVFLLANTFVVVKREGLSLSHLLPGLLALCIVMACVGGPVLLFVQAPPIVLALALLVLMEGSYVAFTFAALLLYSWLYRRLPKRRDYDYIVVHGAGLSGTKPTPLLAARLDKAVELWEADHRRAVIIASGGQGADEEVSEAEAMRTYLAITTCSARPSTRTRSGWPPTAWAAGPRATSGPPRSSANTWPSATPTAGRSWLSSCSGSLSPPSRCSSCNALRARARRRTA